MSGNSSQKENPLSRLSSRDTFRIVRDIFADELGKSRGDAFDSLSTLSWNMDTSVRSGEIGLDSLERFTMASRLNETFSLHESGVEDNLLRADTLGDTVEVVLTGLRHYSGGITFFTGGTTGAPRPQYHRTELLAQEIRFLKTLFQDRRRILVTVPVHHIYGFLFGVLLPRELDLPVVEAKGTFLSGSRAPVSGDLVISVPFLWERYVPAVSGWDGDVRGVCSTAPLPAEQARQLCSGGLASLVEVYGSSETGGIAWRDCCAGEESFTLFPYWSFATDTTVEDGDSPGTAGDDSAAAAGTSMETGDAVVLVRQEPSGGEVSRWELPDRVIRGAGDRLVPVGRRDAVVQVGGTNVNLDELRMIILDTVEGIEECALRLGHDGRIKAFLVLSRSGDRRVPLSAEEIRRAIRAVLPDRAVPSVTTGERVPRDETGKLLDW